MSVFALIWPQSKLNTERHVVTHILCHPLITVHFFLHREWFIDCTHKIFFVFLYFPFISDGEQHTWLFFYDHLSFSKHVLCFSLKFQNIFFSGLKWPKQQQRVNFCGINESWCRIFATRCQCKSSKHSIHFIMKQKMLIYEYNVTTCNMHEQGK